MDHRRRRALIALFTIKRLEEIIVSEVRAAVDVVVGQWVKEHSGLTWDQLGKVFGVSRRAVHMWANGGRLNETNAQRLREFASIIEHLEAETPSTPEVIWVLWWLA